MDKMFRPKTAFGWVAHQLRNSFYRELPSPHVCRIQLIGGFPYESFDGFARIKPWSVATLVESGRAFGFNAPEDDPNSSLLDFEKLYTNGMGFIASCYFEYSDALYDSKTKKSPLNLTKKLLYAGKSSINVETIVKHPESSSPLILCRVQTVLVSRETRKPTSLPSWWKEKYQQYSQKDAALSWRLEEKRPQNCKSHSLTIQPSDCDPYFHLNWSNYLKYCCDALLSSNLKSGQIRELKQPKVKTAYFTFLKECSAGDQLFIIFWSKDERMFFEIENSDKTVIYQAQLDLYPS